MLQDVLRHRLLARLQNIAQLLLRPLGQVGQHAAWQLLVLQHQAQQPHHGLQAHKGEGMA